MTNGETTSGGPARPAWSPSPGVLVIAGTPLGNAGDATDRLRTAIRSVDLIAAEDTRRFRRLARDLGVELSAPVTSYFDQNEKDRQPELIDALRSGKSVLLVTDAGMPSVSDPGYRLVSAAIDANLAVTCLPGPSSVTVALALSGLPCDRFCFEGFLPRKPGERQRALAPLATERRTMVFFEAPHRLLPMLEAVRDVFGADRRAAVCRELTKTYEEVRRGTLGELAEWAADGVRGEITVVIEGAGDVRREYAADELAALVADEVAKGMSKKDAVVLVATTTGTPKRTVFDAFHALR
ncbi:16S rRNA (cytidine1402-2'-O)-methyltransferase [Antricoccus suffuscus]|uniref:Ribosomal RNA small subunit methyltransferase I n=1 Tax=Antricoccus suffuscus TaxID=1629062 RepID=A0A2T0ZZX4_9ACTN|nr:16S rRNA (cytidine(1402)-2'-O)-methyltransferase [Antricoccus suffuscus]PRZ41906.1 16S rRNA (cytidine1402-2'-O)-methyltransferase [Antricoccus suffuscus]